MDERELNRAVLERCLGRTVEEHFVDADGVWIDSSMGPKTPCVLGEDGNFEPVRDVRRDPEVLVALILKYEIETAPHTDGHGPGWAARAFVPQGGWPLGWVSSTGSRPLGEAVVECALRAAGLSP